MKAVVLSLCGRTLLWEKATLTLLKPLCNRPSVWLTQFQPLKHPERSRTNWTGLFGKSVTPSRPKAVCRRPVQTLLSIKKHNRTTELLHKGGEKRSKLWMNEWINPPKLKSQLLLQRAWQKPSHHSCPVAAYLSITALPYLMLLPLICEYCVLPDTLEALAPLRHWSERIPALFSSLTL